MMAGFKIPILTVIYKDEKKILYKDHNPRYIPFKNNLISFENNNDLYYVYDVKFLVPNIIIVNIQQLIT